MVKPRSSQFLAYAVLAIWPATLSAQVSEDMNAVMKVECQLTKECDVHGECRDKASDYTFEFSGNEDRHGVGEYKMLLNGVGQDAINMSMAGPLMWFENEEIHMLTSLSSEEAIWTFRPESDRKEGWVRFLRCSEGGL
ncbi:hypothetical protein [Neogemmobacter tilapiae]|uniref:Uncharacterized protein n=1 Tax=Neogemmobacter tilapiae TaxID=875041 RepID=A0A918WFQ9_9RHOB|nr:hypothetical protein [Gemmobacter tilapiae]GHC43194.1 hypothetical protein GCM10007315_00170 [Gemmobacter tilapiae]